MAEPLQNSPDLLCEEILADARRFADETLRAARTQADEILSKAAADAEKERSEKMSQAQVEAARRSELVLAAVPVEVARMKAARIETLLDSIRDEIRRQLDAPCNVIALATEAIERMSGDEFVLNVSSMLDDAAIDEIKRRVGRPNLRITVEESADVENGVIVQDAEGRQRWDNRLAARLERMWPEMRRQIALQTGLVSGGAK